VWLAPGVRERRRATAPNRCAHVFWSTRTASGRDTKSPELGPLTTIKNAVRRLSDGSLGVFP
jgi:hypothetical protein